MPTATKKASPGVGKPSLVSLEQCKTIYLKSEEKNEEKNNLIEALEKILQAVQRAPLRGGTYIAPVTSFDVQNIVRGKVILQNGDEGCAIFLDQSMAEKVRRGDKVWLDPQGGLVVAWEPQNVKTGEVCTYLRRLDADRIHVSLRGEDEKILYLSDELWVRMQDQELRQGAKIIAEVKTQMALTHVPDDDDEDTRYAYLQRVDVPNISIETDIGDPPAYLDRMSEHLLLGMTQPEIFGKYKLRKSSAVLLEGVSGSGKTYSILGLWRRMYEIMSRVTGVPISDIPHRVFKLDCSKVLSMWFGESDRKIANFFDEVEDLCSKPVTLGGKEWDLPVMVIAEEIDGIARRRGSDPIYDRIQTTLLQRMDATSAAFANHLTLFVCTTNTPHLVDEAFMRRAGGEVEHFGRLEQRGFVQVLGKHIKNMPFAKDGKGYKEAKKEAINDVLGWLFSDEPGETKLVEIETDDSVLVKHRKDFLTCGLDDRAVQEAVRVAVNEEVHGSEDPGLNGRVLITAFENQINHVVEQLKPYNVQNYLALPDGVEVSDVRRMSHVNV